MLSVMKLFGLRICLLILKFSGGNSYSIPGLAPSQTSPVPSYVDVPEATITLVQLKLNQSTTKTTSDQMMSATAVMNVTNPYKPVYETTENFNGSTIQIDTVKQISNSISIQASSTYSGYHITTTSRAEIPGSPTPQEEYFILTTGSEILGSSMIYLSGSYYPCISLESSIAIDKTISIPMFNNTHGDNFQTLSNIVEPETTQNLELQPSQTAMHDLENDQYVLPSQTTMANHGYSTASIVSTEIDRLSMIKNASINVSFNIVPIGASPTVDISTNFLVGEDIGRGPSYKFSSNNESKSAERKSYGISDLNIKPIDRNNSNITENNPDKQSRYIIKTDEVTKESSSSLRPTATSKSGIDMKINSHQPTQKIPTYVIYNYKNDSHKDKTIDQPNKIFTFRCKQINITMQLETQTEPSSEEPAITKIEPISARQKRVLIITLVASFFLANVCFASMCCVLGGRREISIPSTFGRVRYTLSGGSANWSVEGVPMNGIPGRVQLAKNKDYGTDKSTI